MSVSNPPKLPTGIPESLGAGISRAGGLVAFGYLGAICKLTWCKPGGQLKPGGDSKDSGKTGRPWDVRQKGMLLVLDLYKAI